MDLLILLSLSGIFGVLAADSFWSACCLKKTVGGTPYTLVDEADTRNFNCVSNCVYERDDNPGGGRFCFKKGYSEVVCNEDSTSSLPTNVPPQDTTDMSIVIAGGVNNYGVLKSTEECVCTTECTCKICPAVLQPGRYSHTLDTLFGRPALCGGGDTNATKKSCLALFKGEWTEPILTIMPRIAHSSLVFSRGLLLMGGRDSPNTTEVVAVGLDFTLDRKIDAACSIPDGSYIIITGGGDILTMVSKYNIMGNEVTLPSLLVGRMQHGCGSYLNGGDTILVVAGGMDKDADILSSTEWHKIGSSVWNVGQPLPRAMSGMASVSIEQGVIILGGNDDANVVRTEILAYKGDTWTAFGNLETARTLAAATKIISTSTVCD